MSGLDERMTTEDQLGEGKSGEAGVGELSWRAATAPSPAAEEIWLLGQPSLGRYLDFVAEAVIDGARIPQRRLADEWRAANDYYAELEEREAGAADAVDWRALDPELQPLAAAVEADPRFGHTFPTLPVTFGMVELDRLVVYQPRVTGTFVERVARRLGPAPDPRAIFHACHPLEAEPPPLEIETTDDDRFLFTSQSHDLRFHEARLFRPAELPGYRSFGAIGGIVGLVVGFGGNFLNVIRSDDRLLLNNGYHRAVALRRLGVTHAPCVIQTVTRRDELALVGPQQAIDDPAFYFRAARPPLLKDFFDPRIAKRLPARPRRKVVEITYEVRRTYVVR